MAHFCRHACVAWAVLLALLACHVATAAARSCDFRSHHPRRYAVQHLKRSRRATPLPPLTATTPALRRFKEEHEDTTHSSSDLSRREDDNGEVITIDGLLNESAWEETPWSDDFVDIEGPRHWSKPWFATRVKMRYDDEFLFIGAFLEETAIWANVTARNDVVFADNDFEVFVDADGSTHNYKELEVNAVNTTWNLWLNRPYRDGGHENSTRVDPAFGFDMFGKGLQTAVFMKGEPNRGTEQQLHFWTVEIALPLKELARHTVARVPPAPQSFWRINFSRVEWAVESRVGLRFTKIPNQREDNWVWSPQLAVDMHMPERWGYIQFRTDGTSDDDDDDDVPLDPQWDVRYLSFELYYAQHAFRDANGQYATTLQALSPFFRSATAFACLDVRRFVVNNTAGTFEAAVTCRGHSDYIARIQHDSYIVVQRVSEQVASIE